MKSKILILLIKFFRLGFFLIVLNFFVMLNFPNLLYGSTFSSPLQPGVESKDQIIGLLVGLGQNMQSGISYVDCISCQFENGVGFGYTFGLSYETPIAGEDSFLNKFKYGGLLHLSNRDIKPTYRENVREYMQEYDVAFPIMYRHTSTISVITAGLMPYISFEPIKFLFIKAGIDFSYVISDNMKHEMELLTRTSTLENGEVVSFYIPAANSERRLYKSVIQDSEIRGLSNFQMSFVPSIGGNIYFTEKLFISPSFQYSLALTDISSYGENLRINAWRINLALKYNITTSSKIYINPNKKPVRRTNAR
jgi:hypothetical protein